MKLVKLDIGIWFIKWHNYTSVESKYCSILPKLPYCNFIINSTYWNDYFTFILIIFYILRNWCFILQIVPKNNESKQRHPDSILPTQCWKNLYILNFTCPLYRKNTNARKIYHALLILTILLILPEDSSWSFELQNLQVLPLAEARCLKCPRKNAATCTYQVSDWFHVDDSIHDEVIEPSWSCHNYLHTCCTHLYLLSTVTTTIHTYTVIKSFIPCIFIHTDSSLTLEVKDKIFNQFQTNTVIM